MTSRVRTGMKKRLTFRLHDQTTITSPEFRISQDEEDSFFDEHLGSDDAGEDLLGSNVEGNDDEIIVILLTGTSAEPIAVELATKFKAPQIADLAAYVKGS